MSGINQSVVLDICRISVTIVDSIGNMKEVSASGFWVLRDRDEYFITNRHNLDPKLKLGTDSDYRLYSLQIELRQFNGDDPCNSTRFFEVDLGESEIRMSENADIAVLISPIYKTGPDGFRCGRVLKTDDLADSIFHSSSVALMDLASFIGYPCRPTSRWWDQSWNLGVARTINIASVSGIPFINDGIPTSDVTLVAGLSFTGSSGSVVMLHQKGIKPGPGLRYDDYVAPKILGVMSGHWRDENEPDMFHHSGLSYYTRSTSILELI